MNAPSRTPTSTIQTVHAAVKGRARYNVRALYRCEPIKRHLETALSQREEIRLASVSALTGTILVYFSSDATHSAIASLTSSLVDQYTTQIQKLPRWRPQASNIDHVVLVSLSREFMERLPLRKIPDRNDFRLFKGCEQERVAYWNAVVKECAPLAEEFLEAVETGIVRELVELIS